MAKLCYVTACVPPVRDTWNCITKTRVLEAWQSLHGRRQSLWEVGCSEKKLGPLGLLSLWGLERQDTSCLSCLLDFLP